MRKIVIHLLVAVVWLCGVVTVVHAQTETKLIASDGAEGDGFGDSVSVSGDRAVVGALYDDDMGQNSGSAYIFYDNGTNWVEEAKLIASDGASVSLLRSLVPILRWI